MPIARCSRAGGAVATRLHRQRREEAWLDCCIGAEEMQAGYAAALGITADAAAAGWRRAKLARRPLASALTER